MIIFLIIVLLAAAVALYLYQALPIITGYAAKNMASAVFIQHRKPADVKREDLGGLFFSLCRYNVNEKDSSVTVSVAGLAGKKAIYRKGLGCTLLNDFTEEEVRSQRFDLPAPPVIDDSVAWPYGDKVSEVIPPLVNRQLLQQAIDNAMQATVNGKPAYTRAVVVVYDGNIVGEKYAPGFDKNSVLLGWSVSKSLTAAMIGILVKQGKLNVDAPAPVAAWQHTPKEKITLKHLLQQTSGLDFEENYTKPCGVTNMLFKHGDMAAYTEGLPLKYEPGTVFNYSSGNSNILSRIIRNTVGPQAYAAFPYTVLFHKINMHSMLLEPDASGTYIGSSYSYATARDFARFGLLYLNNGAWNGEQILPANWVQQTTEPAAADKCRHYGYQFWLNGLDEKDPLKPYYPAAPPDMFLADGYGGQDIYIIPSRKLVIVRMGLQKIDENKLLAGILAGIGTVN